MAPGQPGGPVRARAGALGNYNRETSRWRSPAATLADQDNWTPIRIGFDATEGASAHSGITAGGAIECTVTVISKRWRTAIECMVTVICDPLRRSAKHCRSSRRTTALL